MQPPSYKSIVKLVWPLALGMANNAIMQFADRVFLSRESEISLAAVFPASMLALVFTSFFQSIVAYSGTFVAQFKGAEDTRGCVRSFSAGLALSVISSIAIMLLIPVGFYIFESSGHTGELLAKEKMYYGIIMSGGFATCAATAAQCYFTGLGSTRIVFWANIFGNVLNIVLNYFLIFGCGVIPPLGIAGAAIATIISQLSQFALLSSFAVKRPEINGLKNLFNHGWLEFRDLLWRIIKIGSPAGVYSVLNVLSFTIFVFITANVGVTELAVSNAVFAVNYLLLAPVEGFAVGAGTLVGQYQGAGRNDWAWKAGNMTLVLAESFIIVGATLAVIFYRPLLSLFIENAQAARAEQFMSLGFILFLLMAAWQCFDTADVTIAGALKGAGDTKFVMVLMLVCAFLIWMPLLFIVNHFHPTMPALWATMIVYIIIISIATIARWKWGPWRKIKLI
jgi:MATE family multidrug resistance protein